ncbi:sce7726 family protein [Burkholderia gladioli]|uniref:sce7726 family protein n=1 Tax=Burkholderia gladioli TaxID=28095 RepID=UPI00164086C5|nr:sce7726 family protein [Burkholderia gladioli]
MNSFVSRTPTSPAPKRIVTRDRDVRAAVLKKVLADHVSDPRVLVMQELGLEHGTCRVDIAVINGSIHGYELKSDSDTLVRLPQQVATYSRALDKATLVVSEKHAKEAAQLLPGWWGIKVSYAGPRGAVHIDTLRSAAINPEISLYHVAHLLWRDEAIKILEALGVEKKELRGSRTKLYALLTELLPSSLLREHVREALRSRKNWRHPSRP